MKMFNKKIFILLIIGILLIPTGCKQILYEMLIQGAWEVDEYYKNGEESTQSFYLLFGDYAIKFHPDGDFTETYVAGNILPVTNIGTWEIINNAEQLRLIDQSATRTYDIISLTKDELRLYRDLGDGEDEELVLEPKEEMPSQQSVS